MVFSLSSIIQAYGFGVAMGASSLISLRLGEKKDHEANGYASSGFFAELVGGLLMLIFGLLFLEPLMRVLGATETMLPHACAYGRIILMGAPIMCCSFVLNCVLRAEGAAVASMIGLCSGGILNIALDPLFIFAFDMGVAGAAAAGRAGRSDIIRNETGQTESYLNPQFRYQGNSADGSRIRSQRLKDEMVDMAVADFNGDGRNEIAILHDHRLVIYKWGNDGRLGKLGEITISRSNLNFSMRAIDLNRDGAKDLVVATFEEESNRPYSYFYSFRGNKFTEVAKRCSYFVSVINLPPSYQPTLVGQGWDSIKLFAPGVYMMVKQNGTYVLGQRINLPSGANVFNVAWIPGKNGDQLVMLTDDERLKIFQGANQTLIHTTMERFSGSATGMEHYKGMPGLGVDRNYQMPSKYFAPMRLIVADIGHTGEYTLLVNKPISTAAQIFDRYRYFPQGEIHALFWDGVGLGLKWKTRRIRGSVAAVDLADFNNDGTLDLVVGLNTSPDLGVGSRQCLVTAYPLDVSQMNPNAPADLSDFEVTPNY